MGAFPLFPSCECQGIPGPSAQAAKFLLGLRRDPLSPGLFGFTSGLEAKALVDGASRASCVWRDVGSSAPALDPLPAP